MNTSSESARMPSSADGPFTAFLGHRRIAHGTRTCVTRAVRRALAPASEPHAAVLVFDDRSGAVVDLDLRTAAPATPSPLQAETPAPRSAGRPKLGVVAREVTLLPQHWEWLSLQPGGASVALRKLVHEARRSQAAQDGVRAAQERGYLFLREIAGNLPGYEEALRALYRRDAAAFESASAGWPEDILAYAHAVSAGAFETSTAS